MHTLVGLLTVLVVSFALGTGAAALLMMGLPPLEAGLALAVSVTMGYLMASVFFRWLPADAAVKRRYALPGIVAALSVVSAFLGLGPALGWVYSTSLIPAHAGMAGWFIGIIASTVVLALACRFIDSRITKRSAATAMGEDGAAAVAGSSWGVPLTRGAGVILLVLLMVGHGIAGPLILHRFGTDASYQTAIGSLVRSIVFLAPLVTIAGFAVERFTRGRNDRRRWISVFLIAVALLAAGEVSWRFRDARGYEPPRLWIDYGR